MTEVAAIGPHYRTREEWLEAGVEEFRHEWPEQFGMRGEESLLPKIKVSIGWTKNRRKHIGETWTNELAADGKTRHIFIVPSLVDASDVLKTLLHETIHAKLPHDAKHKRPFIEVAQAVGLTKPWTSSTASEGLAERLKLIAEKLGPYPHVGLNQAHKEKQPTRMLLYECPEGVKIRHAGTDLNARCEDCGEMFTLQTVQL